jgi:hypothetical protein
MKPYYHGRNSVKKWGGKPEDYQAIHDFIDHSKSHFADVRHRALLHSSFGIFLVEQIFGDRTVNEKGEIIKHPYITNSQGIKVQVRDIAEHSM